MPVSSEFRSFVSDQLSALPHDQRRMFGGVGLFSDGLMFGMIARSDTLFLKTDETTLPDYEALDSAPFTYTRNGVERTMGGYYEVPAEILDDPEELTVWAQSAIAVSRRLAGNKKRRGRTTTASGGSSNQ